jgi:TnpA family transposase
MRTVFLADNCVKGEFRRGLLRVLNRGEYVDSLRVSISVGRRSGYQAKQHDEMHAIADALRLLVNVVMAWNTKNAADTWSPCRSFNC